MIDVPTEPPAITRPAERTAAEVNKIAEANFGLVGYTIDRFKRRFPEVLSLIGSFEDMFQIGCVGLLLAIRKHDPARGKLSTYAVASIYRHLWRAMRNASMVHVPEWIKGERRDELMKEFKCVRFADVNPEGDSEWEPEARPEQETPSADELAALAKAMRGLSPRDRKVLQWRAEGMTLRAIGRRYHKSRQAIQQREVKALRKLRRRLRA
jgi:RNA polymerase sigma factor (sigma-70 family)